jgi:DinB superfamily
VDRCDGCGYVYDLAPAGSAAAGAAIAAGADRVAALVVAAPAPADRRRPERWSPLEYGCHLRDMLLVQRERVLAARWRELPDAAPMGRDERVGFDGYAAQDPAAVARQLRDAATLFANVLDRLDAAAWERRLVYHYPARAERSLRWVAAHTLHEIVHHERDIAGQLR